MIWFLSLRWILTFQSFCSYIFNDLLRPIICRHYTVLKSLIHLKILFTLSYMGFLTWVTQAGVTWLRKPIWMPLLLLSPDDIPFLENLECGVKNYNLKSSSMENIPKHTYSERDHFIFLCGWSGNFHRNNLCSRYKVLSADKWPQFYCRLCNIILSILLLYLQEYLSLALHVSFLYSQTKCDFIIYNYSSRTIFF